MTTIDNYLAAFESAIKSNSQFKKEEARASLVEFVRKLLEEERSRQAHCAADLDDDPVHPNHYASFDPEIDIDCRTAMRAAFGKENVKQGFLQNAFEYIWRSPSKGKNVDIQKAIKELQMFLELGGYE